MSLDIAGYNLSYALNTNKTKANLLSNDAANSTTNGYKRRRISCQDNPYNNFDSILNSEQKIANNVDGKEENINALQIGTGATISSSVRVHEQGAIKTTGRKLDFALHGTGYFRCLMPDGSYGYTRAGSFSVSDSGKELMTDQGYIIDAQINLEKEDIQHDITIDSKTGNLMGGENGEKKIGNIRVFVFSNEEALESKGENILSETLASGKAEELELGLVNSSSTRLVNHALEQSNVNIYQLMQEMNDLKEESKLLSTIIKMIHDMQQTS